MTHDRIVSVDAESNGLHGRAFAVAVLLSSRTGPDEWVLLRCPVGELEYDPWVSANVLPAITDIDENCDYYEELLHRVAETLHSFGAGQRRSGNAVPVIGHVIWPVEARLLLDVYSGMRVWDAPYPLLDVASMLHATGEDPTTVDGYLTRHGIDLPDGSPHHPLYDARAAAACYWQLMGQCNHGRD